MDTMINSLEQSDSIRRRWFNAFCVYTVFFSIYYFITLIAAYYVDMTQGQISSLLSILSGYLLVFLCCALMFW